MFNEIHRRLWVIEFTRIYMDTIETIILPSLPALTLYLMIPDALAQLTIPAFLVGKTMTKILLLNDFAERHDKTKVMASFLLLSIVGSIIALIPNIHWIILGRLVQGVGVGCVTSISTTLVKENVGGSFLKNWTTIGMINVWVGLLSTFLGGMLLTLFGWQSIFIFLILLGIICVFFTHTYIPKQPALKGKINENSYRIFFKHPLILGEIITFSLIYSGQVIIYTITPLMFIKMYHWSAHYYWIIMLFFSTGLFLGKVSVHHFNERIKRGGSKFIILFITMLASMGLVLVDHLRVTYVIEILLLIGVYGIAQSALSVLIRDEITHHFEHHISVGIAGLGIVQSGAGAIFGIIAAAYFHTEPRDLGLILLFLSGAAFIIFAVSHALSYWFRRRQ